MARTKFRRVSTVANGLAPIIRLWMLRMLVPLGGHRSLSLAWDKEEVPRALGLDHWVDGEAEPPKPKAAFAELARLHQQAEIQSARLRTPPQLQRNVARLGDLVGLSRTETSVLEFAVLLHDDSVLAKTSDLLGELSSNGTVEVLATVLALPGQDVRGALAPSGKLSRSGLVANGAYTESSLKNRLGLLSHAFPQQMLGEATDIMELMQGTVSVAPPPQLALDDFLHVTDLLKTLRPYLKQTLNAGRHGVNVFVHGPPGTGKSELARVLAKDIGSELFQVPSEDEDGNPIDGDRRLRAFRLAQNLLGKRRTLMVFDEAEDVFPHDLIRILNQSSGKARAGKAWLNRMLEENTVPTIWLSNSCGLDPAFIRRFDMVFELPVPPMTQRRKIAYGLCHDLTDADSVERIAGSPHVAPAVVARAAHVVRCVAEQIDAQDRRAALERLISNTLKAQGHDALDTHSALAGALGAYDPALIHTDTDMAQVSNGLMTVRSGRLCLYGPPGTGKTAYGRWLAQQLGMPLVIKRASDLLSMWVGETEKNIRKAFDHARDADAVLMIDEVDSFLQSRLSATRHWQTQQINEMLTQLEHFEGIFVGSTNLMDRLDFAALRRFDLKAKFDYLRPEQAVSLLRRHCAHLNLAAPNEADEAELRRSGAFTPGDFAAVVRQHRFRCFVEPRQLVEALLADCALRTGGKGRLGFV